MAFKSIGTNRLKGVQLRGWHFDELRKIHREQNVMATLGGTVTDEHTREALRSWAKHWEEWGFGVWMVYSKRDGRLAGRAGLQHCKIEQGDEVELFYASMPEYWGKGLATELAMELTRIGFECIGLREIISFASLDNVASQNVIEKLGFHRERKIVQCDSPQLLYRKKV